MKPSFSLVLTALACLGISASRADLLFSDDFNSYTAGGIGGQGTWTGGNAGLTVTAGGLTYGSLYTDSTGNMFSIANGAAGSIVSTYANQTSGTIFYSFLFQPTVVDSGNTYFTALNPGTGAPNGGSDAIDAYYYSNGKIYVRGNAQSANAGTGAALTLNTTYFIVEELDLSSHTASLWINPDSSTFGTLTAPTATASLTSLTATAVDNVGFKAQSGTGSFYIDNILIGTTWADVTTVPAPVPEPSVLALAGIGLTGLLLRLRRR